MQISSPARLAVLLVAAAAAASAGRSAPCPSAPPGAGTVPPDELAARLRPAWDKTVAAAQALLDSGAAPSSTVMSMVAGGRTLFSAELGSLNASASPGVPPTRDTVYRLGSVTKLFPMLAAAAAEERGLLPRGLATRFGELDARFAITGADGTPGTAGPSLLSTLYQMGGLPREAPFTFAALPNVTTDEALKAIAAEQWMIAPEWTLSSYSNLGFALIGHLVSESAFGLNFTEWLQEEVARPLGLASLGMDFPPDVVARMPVPYGAPGVVSPLLDIGWVGPAGQARVSPRDWDTFSAAILAALAASGEGGDASPAEKLPLSPDAVRRLFASWRANGPGDTGIGMPFEMVRAADTWIHAKGGNTAAFSALTSFAPELGAAINVFWNGPVNELGFCRTVWAEMAPALREALGAEAAYAKPPAGTAHLYEGVYDAGTLNLTIGANAGGWLEMHVGDQDVKLPAEYVSGPRFRLRAVPVDNEIPCFSYQLEALDRAYMVFEMPRHGGGPATGLRINPLGPGQVLPRLV